MDYMGVVFAVLSALLILVILIILVIETKRRAENEKATRKLEAALAEAEAATKMRNTFLYCMSHDIRIPVNAIMGFTELMRKNINDKELLEDYMTKLSTAEGYLLSLLGNITEMSGLENNQITVEEIPVDILGSVENLKNYIGDRADKKFITVNAYEEIVYPYIFEDKNHMVEVIMHLVDNALFYTPDGGAVEFYVKQMEGRNKDECLIQFGCIDNGEGMSQSFINQIMDDRKDLFVTENTSQHTSGLGLSIVRRIVELMGGTMTIDSELGKGTKITVDVYHRYATREDVEEYNKDSLKVNTPLGEIKVLIVEDNELNQEIAYELLSEAGFVADVAPDGKAACDLLISNPEAFDVVLMDIQMPVMDGYEATKKIRSSADPKLANIPVIAMTANAFQKDRDAAIEAGMNEFITKPIDVDQVVGTISRVLGRSERGNRIIDLT